MLTPSRYKVVLFSPLSLPLLLLLLFPLSSSCIFVIAFVFVDFIAIIRLVLAQIRSSEEAQKVAKEIFDSLDTKKKGKLYKGDLAK